MADISQTTCSNAFSWMNIWISISISLNLVAQGQINNIPSLVQIMSRPRPGDKPSSEPMMVNLPTHICATLPQWVKIERMSIEWCIYCPACRTTFVATRFRVAVICPIIPVPHCIRVFFYFVWFVFINHIFQFYYELCTYCNILDIYLS